MKVFGVGRGLLVLSWLCMAASASARQEKSGETRYRLAYGYLDAHGLFDPGPDSYAAFQLLPSVGAPDRDSREPQMIRITSLPTMRRAADDYVCDYVLSELPLDQRIDVRVSVAGGRGLSMAAWLGGEEGKAYLQSLPDADHPAIPSELRAARISGLPPTRPVRPQRPG